MLRRNAHTFKRSTAGKRKWWCTVKNVCSVITTNMLGRTHMDVFQSLSRISDLQNNSCCLSVSGFLKQIQVTALSWCLFISDYQSAPGCSLSRSFLSPWGKCEQWLFLLHWFKTKNTDETGQNRGTVRQGKCACLKINQPFKFDSICSLGEIQSQQNTICLNLDFLN